MRMPILTAILLYVIGGIGVRCSFAQLEDFDNRLNPNFVEVQVLAVFEAKAESGNRIVDEIAKRVDKSGVTGVEIIYCEVTAKGRGLHPGFGDGAKLYLVTKGSQATPGAVLRFTAYLGSGIERGSRWNYSEHNILGAKVLLLSGKLYSPLLSRNSKKTHSRSSGQDKNISKLKTSLGASSGRYYTWPKGYLHGLPSDIQREIRQYGAPFRIPFRATVCLGSDIDREGQWEKVFPLFTDKTPGKSALLSVGYWNEWAAEDAEGRRHRWGYGGVKITLSAKGRVNRLFLFLPDSAHDFSMSDARGPMTKYPLQKGKSISQKAWGNTLTVRVADYDLTREARDRHGTLILGDKLWDRPAFKFCDLYIEVSP